MKTTTNVSNFFYYMCVCKLVYFIFYLKLKNHKLKSLKILQKLQKRQQQLQLNFKQKQAHNKQQVE